MSNLINTNYALKEANTPVNTNNEAQVSYVGFKPQFKGAQTNDTFESSENKNSKAAWITLLSLTGLTALALSLLARKGGKTLGKDAKLGEKIEQGWKELWGKGKKAAEETTNRPQSGTNTNDTVKPNQFELSQADKEAAERIKNGYLLPEPKRLPLIDEKGPVTYERQIEKQFSKSEEYKNNISYVEEQIKAEIETKALKEKAEAEAKAAKKQLRHEKMVQQRKLRKQMKAGKAVREEEARKQQIHEKMVNQRKLRQQMKEGRAIRAEEERAKAEAQAIKEGEEYLRKEEEAAKKYIRESDTRNTEWLNQQRFDKEAEYAYIWEKEFRRREMLDQREAFVNWFQKDKRLMDYFKLTEADLDRVVCDENGFKITKENGLSIRYYPDGIKIYTKPDNYFLGHTPAKVDTKQTSCFAVGKEALLDKLEQKTAGMNSGWGHDMIDSAAELDGIRFIKFFDDAMISLRPNKNKIIRNNNGAMIYIDAKGRAKMFAGGKERNYGSEGKIFDKAFDNAFRYPTKMNGHAKYNFKDSLEITEERIGDVGSKTGFGEPPVQTVAVLTPEAKQKRINNMIERYVEMHPGDGFQRCSKDCVVYRDGIKENIHIVYEGDLYDIDSSGRLLQKVKVHRKMPNTFERQLDETIAEIENASRVDYNINHQRHYQRQQVRMRR